MRLFELAHPAGREHGLEAVVAEIEDLVRSPLMRDNGHPCEERSYLFALRRAADIPQL